MSDLIHPFDLVAGAIGCDRDSLSEDSEMYRDHGWDSLGHVTVLVALEKSYGITIDDESVQRFRTMREILKCYNRLRETGKDGE